VIFALATPASVGSNTTPVTGTPGWESCARTILTNPMMTDSMNARRKSKTSKVRL
jgi:hypothetical protein